MGVVCKASHEFEFYSESFLKHFGSIKYEFILFSKILIWLLSSFTIVHANLILLHVIDSNLTMFIIIISWQLNSNFS